MSSGFRILVSRAGNRNRCRFLKDVLCRAGGSLRSPHIRCRSISVCADRFRSGPLPFLLALAVNSLDAFGAFKHALTVFRVARRCARCLCLRHSHDCCFTAKHTWTAVPHRRLANLCARHGGSPLFDLFLEIGDHGSAFPFVVHEQATAPPCRRRGRGARRGVSWVERVEACNRPRTLLTGGLCSCCCVRSQIDQRNAPGMCLFAEIQSCPVGIEFDNSRINLFGPQKHERRCKRVKDVNTRSAIQKRISQAPATCPGSVHDKNGLPIVRRCHEHTSPLRKKTAPKWCRQSLLNSSQRGFGFFLNR